MIGWKMGLDKLQPVSGRDGCPGGDGGRAADHTNGTTTVAAEMEIRKVSDSELNRF